MTDYSELVKALRYCAESGDFNCNKDCPMYPNYPKCLTKMDMDAAAAIEELQAEVQFYDALAEEWKSIAKKKERLLGLYRSEQVKHFYSATDNNGRIIENPCACMNIPIFSDCSENPNG